jgi:thiopurine S-methyltransferase
MENSFWHQRWENNEIPFHEAKANPLLVKHFRALSLNKGDRVFVPLCGKTLDIHWLLSKGCRVAGAELSKIAVEQLFAELGIKPSLTTTGKLTRYSAENIDIFLGDIFDLAADILGPVDAVYDRAALVALPPPMRDQYTAHLLKMTDCAPQLLICFDYDQSQLDGPPFSVSDPEVKRHYKDSYNLTLVERASVAGGLKGKCAASENVWLLRHD